MPTKAVKPTINHFSCFVNLLAVGWDAGAVVPTGQGGVCSCSSKLDMQEHKQDRVKSEVPHKSDTHDKQPDHKNYRKGCVR